MNVQAKETPYKGVSLERARTSCRMTANSRCQELKTYDKVWWGCANCGGGLVSPMGCGVQKTMQQLRQVFGEGELAEDGLEKEAAKGLPR